MLTTDWGSEHHVQTYLFWPRLNLEKRRRHHSSFHRVTKFLRCGFHIKFLIVADRSLQTKNKRFRYDIKQNLVTFGIQQGQKIEVSKYKFYLNFHIV